MREVENLDVSVEIRGFHLKPKLKARYPLLQFLKPIKRNSSEIVFCKEGFSLLADRWTSQSDLIWRNWRAPIVNMTVKAKGHNLDQIIIDKSSNPVPC